MTPLSFIQSRIADIEHYINSVELKVTRKIEGTEKAIHGENAFNQVLETKINETEQLKLSEQEQSLIGKNLPKDFPNYIKETVKEVSAKLNVELPENLVLSVIKQESGFNPDAVSSAGAEGLMQLMPQTAKEMGVFNSKNPYQNLKGGVKYLATQIKAFDGHIPKALAAYNAGPQAVQKYKGIPPYRETQNYVESIMSDFLAKEEAYKPIDTTV